MSFYVLVVACCAPISPNYYCSCSSWRMGCQIRLCWVLWPWSVFRVGKIYLIFSWCHKSAVDFDSAFILSSFLVFGWNSVANKNPQWSQWEQMQWKKVNSLNKVNSSRSIDWWEVSGLGLLRWNTSSYISPVGRNLHLHVHLAGW